VEVQHRAPNGGLAQFRTDVRLNNNLEYTQTIHLNGMGQLDRINHSRFNVQYTYDPLHQLAARITSSNGAHFAHFFMYENGRLTQDEFWAGNVANRRRYTYHPNGNVHTVSINGVLVQEFWYDEHNRLTHYINHQTGFFRTKMFDNGGNPILIGDMYVCFDSGMMIPGNTFVLQYDSQWRDLLTSINGQPITHDQIGNPLQYRDGMEMTWKNGRQLHTVTTSDWGTITMEYDYQGRRTRKTRSDGTNHFYFWDGNRLIAEQHGSRRLWFFYDDQGVSGLSMSNQDFFFRRNIFGDVVAIYCQNGILQGRYEYCPWGNTTIIPYANNLNVMNWNPFRWRGKFQDQETGFFYLNSRFYDPQTGRFINADDPRMLFLTAPMGQSGSNLFAYALNNPIMFRDDTGYFPAAILAAIVLTVFVIVPVVSAVAYGYYRLLEWAWNEWLDDWLPTGVEIRHGASGIPTKPWQNALLRGIIYGVSYIVDAIRFVQERIFGENETYNARIFGMNNHREFNPMCWRLSINSNNNSLNNAERVFAMLF